MSTGRLTQPLAPMTLFNVTGIMILVSAVLGTFALLHAAGWKLWTESIDSPNLVVRWIYRYLIYSFYFGMSFPFVGPLTTWQLIKIPVVAAFARQQSWTLLVLTAIPAFLLYHLHRRYVIWCDPVKIKARKNAYIRSKR
jgi:hypothetical protein